MLGIIVLCENEIDWADYYFIIEVYLMKTTPFQFNRKWHIYINIFEKTYVKSQNYCHNIVLNYVYISSGIKAMFIKTMRLLTPLDWYVTAVPFSIARTFGNLKIKFYLSIFYIVV